MINISDSLRDIGDIYSISSVYFRLLINFDDFKITL
jgi:hypothetical protein